MSDVPMDSDPDEGRPSLNPEAEPNETVFVRPGDPAEFDDETNEALAKPNSTDGIDVPAGFMRHLLADPMHVPELLAARTVEQLSRPVEKWSGSAG